MDLLPYNENKENLDSLKFILVFELSLSLQNSWSVKFKDREIVNQLEKSENFNDMMGSL